MGTFIAAGANLFLNLIFVPRWGATAAAYTTLISYVLSMLLHMINAHKIDAQYFPIRNVFIFAIVFVVTGVVSSITSMEMLIRYTILACLGAIYILVGCKKYREVCNIDE